MAETHTTPEALVKDTTVADSDLIMKTNSSNVTKTVTAGNFFTWLWGKIKGSTKSTLDAKDPTAPVNTNAVNGALADYSRATMTDYNLNNYLTEGNFCCVGNDNNYTNCPSGYNANFSFEVKRVMSNDDKYVIQFFRPYGESREFIRSNYYAGDRGILWTDWKPSDFLKEKVVNIGDVTVSGSNYALLYSEEGIKIVSIQLQYWSDNTGAFSINAYLDNRVYLLASNGFSIKNLQLKLFYV